VTEYHGHDFTATHARLNVAQRLFDRCARPKSRVRALRPEGRENRFRITGELAKSTQDIPRDRVAAFERDTESSDVKISVCKVRMSVDEGHRWSAAVASPRSDAIPRQAFTSSSPSSRPPLRAWRHARRIQENRSTESTCSVADPEDGGVLLSTESHLAEEPRRGEGNLRA